MDISWTFALIGTLFGTAHRLIYGLKHRTEKKIGISYNQYFIYHKMTTIA